VSTPTNPRGGIQYEPQSALLYNPVVESVVISPDKLELLLRDFDEAKQRKTIREVLPWIGLTAGCLFTLLTAKEFKDFMNVPASTWAGAVLVGCLVFGLIAIREMILWIMSVRKASPTAREFVQSYLRELRGPTP